MPASPIFKVPPVVLLPLQRGHGPSEDGLGAQHPAPAGPAAARALAPAPPNPPALGCASCARDETEIICRNLRVVGKLFWALRQFHLWVVLKQFQGRIEATTYEHASHV
jgi:hypothetical protein